MTFPIGSVEFSGRFYKEDFGCFWMLIIHQQLEIGFFETKDHALNSQTPGLYSILDEIHNNSKIGDSFEFLLEYSNGKHNIWRQCIFPLYELKDASTEDQNVSGYEPIEIQMPSSYWGGLRKSVVPSSLLDGSTKLSYWHFSVGTLNNTFNSLISYESGDIETILWVRALSYPNRLIHKCTYHKGSLSRALIIMLLHLFCSA